MNEILALFFIYAMLGWVLEVVFCSVKDGKFTNRGFLAGPWCPIYGFGGLLMVHLLTPLDHSALLVFLGAMAIASTLELVGGWALEKIFHQRWWEYDDMPFNVGGYICLAYSLAWGAGGVILMRALHPAVLDVLSLIPGTFLLAFNGVMVLMVGVDLAASVQAALKLGHQLELLNRASAEFKSLTDKWSEDIGTSAIDLQGDAERLVDKAKSELADARQKLEELASLPKSSARLLTAFPNMRSQRHAEALEIMKATQASGRLMGIQLEELFED